MIRPTAKTYAAMVFVVVLPFALEWLARNTAIGLLALLIYNIYYLPLSWVGAPFYSHAAEIGVVPHLPGYILAALFYAAVVLGISAAWSRSRLRRQTEGTN